MDIGANKYSDTSHDQVPNGPDPTQNDQTLSEQDIVNTGTNQIENIAERRVETQAELDGINREGSTNSINELQNQSHLVSSNKPGFLREHFHKLVKILVWILPNFLLAIVQYFNRSDTIRWGILMRRGSEFTTRYEARREKDEIDHAIICFQDALRLCPRGGGAECFSLYNLANSYHSRYYGYWDFDDMEAAIVHFKSSLLLPLNEVRGRQIILDCLAFCLITRYGQKGDAQDLVEGIQYCRDALQLPGNLDRTRSLSNLATSLGVRYKKQGDARDLDEAIRCINDALQLQPSDDIDRSTSLNELGGLLGTRYESRGDVQDLDAAIQHNREALQLRSPGHPNRTATLNNLAAWLNTRYIKQGGVQDLEEAIGFGRDAVKLCGPKHPDRLPSLVNLATSLGARYERQGDVKDLQEAIDFSRKALRRCPTGHPDRSKSLINLANFLGARYDKQGQVKDLEEAIKSSRTALQLCPEGHAGQSSSLGSLINNLQTRYKQFGDPQDLEEVVQLSRRALQLCPPEDPKRPMSLNNLATCLATRHKAQGRVEDLTEAIDLSRETLQLCPPEHPNRSTSLSNLASYLRTHFEQYGRAGDLKEAIQFNREVLQLRPLGHPGRSTSLHNLAACLITRYKRKRKLRDLEEVVQFLKEAIHISPPDHPLLADFWTQLGIVYTEYGEVLGSSYEPDEATRLFQRATHHDTASFQYRLSASLVWVSKESGPSLLQAYSKSLELADQYLLVQSSIVSRHQRLSAIPHSLALDAAAYAINMGDTEKAVEFLEQGRSLLWSQMGRYRISLHALQEANKELAEEFGKLSRELESSATLLGPNDVPRNSAEDEAQKYREVSDAWKATVEKIRTVEGFSNFLLQASFPTLKQACINGPIIVINISNLRSDAIIVQQNIKPCLLPLPNTGPDDITRYHSEFTQAIRSDKPSKTVQAIVQALWEEIVQPIVAKLEELDVPHHSRIWWCPTFKLAMLPLHAAGPHRRKKPNLPDIYISSYTMTLSALLRSSETDPSPPTLPSSRLLLVGQPETPGQPKIPNVWQELQRIQATVPSIDLLIDEHGTRDTVLDGLKTHSWVHFSCHGSQNVQDPFKSCLHLHDKSLNLLDIVQARLPDARYAFLSACHSAAGDTARPDETIHMAASLQFSGFRSVIGTMYAMADVDGPTLTEEVYRYLFRQAKDGQPSLDGSVMNHRDAAEALNIATKVLRNGNVPVERWINFVHIGA